MIVTAGLTHFNNHKIIGPALGFYPLWAMLSHGGRDVKWLPGDRLSREVLKENPRRYPFNLMNFEPTGSVRIVILVVFVVITQRKVVILTNQNLPFTPTALGWPNDTQLF